MKKIICPALAAIILMLSLAGCGSVVKPKLVDVPDEITIDTASLSDTLQTDQTSYDAAEFPLVASVPSEGVFIYDINVSGQTGLLVKYNNVLQYFNWTYFRITSQPEVAVYDYDGDGDKEIAISLLTNKGQTNYNEDLYILEYSKGKLDYINYLGSTMCSAAEAIVSYQEKDEANQYSLTDGKNFYTLDFSNRESAFQGLYFDAYCDYSLDEKITSTVKIRYIFEDVSIPEDSEYTLSSELSYSSTDHVGIASSHIVAE